MPPIGFQLATNGIQSYAIANLDKYAIFEVVVPLLRLGFKSRPTELKNQQPWSQCILIADMLVLFGNLFGILLFDSYFTFRHIVRYDLSPSTLSSGLLWTMRKSEGQAKPCFFIFVPFLQHRKFINLLII